jgi:hypothetical protein
METAAIGQECDRRRRVHLRLAARHRRADVPRVSTSRCPSRTASQVGNSAVARGSKLARRVTEEGLRGIDEGIGELAVLHKLADMAIEGGADRSELGEMNVSPAGLDAVIGQTRHAEDAGRGFLGKPQHAAPAP